MKNNIIVHTNIDDIDLIFAKYSVDFAKSVNAKITFCDIVTAEIPNHAITQPNYIHAGEMPVYTNRIEKVTEAVERKLSKLCHQLSNEWEHIDYKVLTNVNYIDALRDLVNELEARYILISKVQSPNFWNKWLGTVSTTVAEELNIPTIIVPQNQKFVPFKHLLHQIELNGMDMSKLKKTLVLSRQLNTKVTATYFDDNDSISNKMFENRTSFLGRMIRYPSISFKYYSTSNLNETLNTLIQASDIDVIALRHHQESILNRIFNTDYTDKIILENDVPFIVY